METGLVSSSAAFLLCGAEPATPLRVWVLELPNKGSRAWPLLADEIAFMLWLLSLFCCSLGDSLTVGGSFVCWDARRESNVWPYVCVYMLAAGTQYF